jgi:hypothetical protein
MSAWRDLRDVLEMYTKGGLVIMTGLDGAVMETAVSSPSSYDGKIYNHTGIRTTIQFDSDYVTVMTPTILQQPEVWQQHVGHVNKKLAVLDKLKALAQKSWMLFLLIPAIWFGVDLANTNSVEEAWSLILPILVSALMVWARKWLLLILQKTLLPLITKTVGWFVQRKFKQFVGDM